MELRASLPEEEAGAGRAMGLPGAAPGTPRPGGTSLAPSGGDPFSRTRGAAMGSGLDKPGPAVGRVGEENKGARRVSRRQPADLTRGRGLAPGLPPGIPDPGTRPDPSDRRRRSCVPFPQALTQACRLKPLRSSSKQAAG